MNFSKDLRKQSKHRPTGSLSLFPPSSTSPVGHFSFVLKGSCIMMKERVFFHGYSQSKHFAVY